MDNFLDEFLKVTRYAECPTSYLEWAAYTSLAAIMRDNIWVKRSKLDLVYPNIYVLIVGDSGNTRKSFPLKCTNALVKPIQNTKIIEGRASIQAVLQKLAGGQTTPQGRRVEGASCLLYSEELASFLVRDPQTSGILTDIYDFHAEHGVLLKSSEEVKLKNVCVTMIAATNAAHIKDMFTITDLRGGLVGRIFFVLEERARQRNSGMYNDQDDNEWTPLVNHLVRLSTIKGEAKFTEEARKYYDEWYMSIDPYSNSSGTGFEPRVGTNVLKMAMLVAANEPEWDLIIERRHVEKSIDIINGIWPNYKKVSMTIAPSKTETNEAVMEIMMTIVKSPGLRMERGLLQRTMLGKVDNDNFDKAIRTLETAKMLKVGGNQTEIYYELTSEAKKNILSEMKTKGPLN